MTRLRATPLFAFAVIVASPIPALAANCKSSGGLTYLGNTRDASRSVWLSRTDQGSFALESAQGSQTVDTWGVPPDRRLHISTSPEVSNGNGGTHKLYETSDNKPCLIDTQNQKRDWNIPPNIQLPNLNLPDRPPIGNFFPDFKPPTLTPGLPIRPQSPIATLPPSGLTPGRPARPPSGVMPGMPGGVQQPIATLPPGGLTPGRPTRPPSGVMPGMPGGVQSPIATLPPGGLTPGRPTRPPSGVMPGMPGGVQQPIATLPPGGLTPGRPTRPPSGVMPGMPGGVQSPIATLPPGGLTPGRPTRPPSGVMPGMPGGVQPPIATLPPGGVTVPGSPGLVRLPDGTLTRTTVAGIQERCIDPRSATTDAQTKWPICPDELLAEAARSGANPGEVPLTEGRDLGAPTLWNAWGQPLFVQVSDQRFGLDMDTQLGSITLGLDRRIGEDWVLGASLAVQHSSTEGFGDLLQADSTGFAIGPYLAVRLSPHWAIDTSLTYGQYDNDLELSVLEGSYQSRQWSGNVTAHGQYTLGEYFVRPKASITYSHIQSDGYDLEGNVLNLPVNVSFPEDSFNFGVIEASTEFSRIFLFENGTSIMPYAEIGATYEFERPNGGQILTADLELATPSAWAGTVRAGARMLFNNSVQVEASGGYLSFGQNGLDVWEGKLQVSFGF
ncbi:outer membrane autotransporter protein [Aminobacter sp. AP02]|nr:outer membrane autotransporter protein [Aminobacter sp. AP02]